MAWLKWSDRFENIIPHFSCLCGGKYSNEYSELFFFFFFFYELPSCVILVEAGTGAQEACNVYWW